VRDQAVEQERDQAAPPRPMAAASEPDLLQLQRTVGNRAVSRMVLSRKEAAPKILRQGASSDEVGHLQAHLNLLDEVTLALSVDGGFGSQTAKAVRQFQSAHAPLKADGEVGPLTAPAIEAAIEEPQDQLVLAQKMFDLGAAAFERGKFGHAYDFFTRSQELAPDRSGLVFSRAQALRRLGGRRREAIALYKEYIAMGGKRTDDAQSGLAQLEASKTGDADADKAAAKKIFEHGAALFEAGDFAHAADEFQRAGEIYDSTGLKFSEAQAVRRMGGQRDRALDLYETYIAEGGARTSDAQGGIEQLRGVPSGDEAADTAGAKKAFDEGAALFESKQYGRAADRFAKSSDLSDRSGLLFSKAQALRKLGGHREEAIALYDEYLAMGGARTSEAKYFRDMLATQGSV
jgi:peptidoglycan hydrolase-like protein with peptidoglycan-binding domain